MTFKEYQEISKKTAVYPDVGDNYVYPTLGLAGEAGEVAEKMKKVIRDDKGEITEKKKQELKKEMGDVLWYLSQLAREVGLSLEDIATFNVNKLQSRQKRGKLKGSGDNR